MKLLKMTLFLLAFAASGAAFARLPVPLVDLVDEEVVAGSGKALGVEEVERIVSKAAQEKKWVVAPPQNDKIRASLSWRNNKHTIMIEIACAAGRYSISYRDSINMNYTVRDGRPMIHPYYNRYVGELRAAIRVEALKF
jgi:hypothetical protein